MEAELEDIAQIAGEIDYSDVYKLVNAAKNDRDFKKKINALLVDWRDVLHEM